MLKDFSTGVGEETNMIWCTAHFKESGVRDSFIQASSESVRVCSPRKCRDESEGKLVVLHVPGNIMHSWFIQNSRLTELYVCVNHVSQVWAQIFKVQQSCIKMPETELLHAAVCSSCCEKAHIIQG